MLVYDEIGRKYYHMGEIEKAKKYHQRYINSVYEPPNSAHKMLSKQRINKSHQLNLEKKYKEISMLFLVHLKVPLKSLWELDPLGIPDAFNHCLSGTGFNGPIVNPFFHLFLQTIS